MPSVAMNHPLPGHYMMMLADLSIPPIDINGAGTLALGLEPGRTTRLHWLQTDLCQAENGTLVSLGTPAIAQYGTFRDAPVNKTLQSPDSPDSPS